MSKRTEKLWTVFISVENSEHDRCVDIFSRADGSYGFEEFRRASKMAGNGRRSNTIRELPIFHQPIPWIPPNDVYLGWSTSSPRSQN
jgi:hypothetical protein